MTLFIQANSVRSAGLFWRKAFNQKIPCDNHTIRVATHGGMQNYYSEFSTDDYELAEEFIKVTIKMYKIRR